MDKLEELKAQRKHIDEQIKILECKIQIHGCAKIDMHNYPKGKEWFIAIKSIQPDGLNKSRWMPVCAAKTKEGAIATIDTILEDLQELKNELVEVNKNDL